MVRLGALKRAAGFCLITALTSYGAPLPQDESSPHQIGRTTEKELKVTLSTSFGSVNISRGEPEKILVLDADQEDSQPDKLGVEYAIRNRIGYLDLSLGRDAHDPEHKGKAVKLAVLEGGTWYLKLSDALPISFDIELGVAKGDFDLSGLQVKDFNLSTGASDVNLSFREENKSSIENLNIESGFSKFDGHNLCNANFKRLHFQGGLGTYSLDFSGQLSSEVDVDLEVGLGVMTVYVPASIGVRVTYDKSWVSKVDCDPDFASNGDNGYISENYYSAEGKINMTISTGMGTVKIRRL
jgi:hypothetical protein